jgi:DNA-binding transcriptional LysR family regulator
LRVSAPVDLGRILVAPWSADLLSQFPGLRLELQISDRLVDLARESIDVALRMGDLEDSSLVATRVGECPFVVCAAPSYLAQAGGPETLADLQGRACLRYMHGGRALDWLFRVDGELTAVSVRGPLDSDDGGALVAAACEGAGLAYLFRFQVEQHLQSGALRQVLAEQVTPTLAISAVRAASRHVAPRIPLWIDFMRRRLSDAGYGSGAHPS